MENFLCGKFTEIVLALMNLTLLLGNVMWQAKNRQIRNVDDLIKTLTDQNNAKDCIIKELKESAHSYKVQYHNLLSEHEKVVAENSTYRRFCNHDDRNIPNNS